MSAENPAETIQTLLEAEEQAKIAIDAARKQRDIRLKQAATEADSEIAQYRVAKDAEYKSQLKKFVGSTGAVSEQIAADAKKSIEKTVCAAQANKSTVVAMLVEYVLRVDTSV